MARSPLLLMPVLAVALSIGCSTTPRGGGCPSLPPAVPEVDSPGPSTVVIGTGSAALALSIRDDARRPVAGRSVSVQCACLPHTLHLTSDARGSVRALQLPAGKYQIEVAREYGGVGVAFEMRDGEQSKHNVRLPTWALEPQRRQPVSALPDGVLLRLRSSGCLGTCVPYTVELFADGTVRSSGTDNDRTWRVSRLARRRALHKARCLANGPSYDAFMATDGRTWEAEVVDGDAVATYEHYSHDARATAARDRFERSIERALGVWRRRVSR